LQRFKKILLVSDEKKGEVAFERAVSLAKANQAQLTLVEVIGEIPRELYMSINVMTPEELRELFLVERQKYLEQLIEPIQQEIDRVTIKVLTGTPFMEIIREVLRNKHDLVIMTAEGRGKIKEILFGSTSLHLMRKCPCPVWVIKSTYYKQYTRILAAVDVDPYNDEERNALNTKIMDLTTSLALLEQSEFHVFHAWDVYRETTLKSNLSHVVVDKLAFDTRQQHRQQFDKLLEKYPLENLKCQLYFLEGKAGILLPELAKEKQIDLIVMGTVCRIGLAGIFIGNTAEKVLQQVDCSVLTVKPDGFATPVMLDG
jgi:nucleotide-binding universal stress UspA family protein